MLLQVASVHSPLDRSGFLADTNTSAREEHGLLVFRLCLLTFYMSRGAPLLVLSQLIIACKLSAPPGFNSAFIIVSN